MRLLMKKAATCLSLMLLAACVTPEGPAITLSAETNKFFSNYLEEMSIGGQGAFAVSPDGAYGFYTYCTGGGRCGDSELKGSALNGCKRLARTDCVILARDKTIYRQYMAAGSQAASAGADGSFYSGDEIARTVSGNTVSGQYPDGKPWLVYFATDHQLRSRGDGPNHAGTWAINGDQLCFDYPGTADDWCARFQKNGDLIDIYRNGSFLRHMPKPKIDAGNPLNL